MSNFALGEESFAITSIGKAYMTQERKKLYIACENMDFVWCEREVNEIKHMWENGLSIQDIARSFDRDADEVTMLIMDLARKGKIEQRPGGAYGKRRRIGT